ncbi:hypothetical protein M406DRAFT_10611, partial [Cryphonectria parasitica EP155]
EELNNTPITPTLSDFPQLHATYPALDSLFTRLQSVTPDPLTALQAIGPCSPMQDNFLVSQRKTPDAYQCRFVVRIDALVPGSKLDPEAVKAHWAQIIARHPILRTTFVESDTRLGRFDQVVWKSIAPWVLTYPDATAIFNDTDFPTYAAHQPQHRLSIAPAPKGGAFVKLDISHALFDGQSTEVLMRDFCFSYLDALETDDALPYLDFTAGELQADTAPTSAYWARYMDNAQGSYLPVRHSLETSGLQSIQAQTVLSPGALSSFCGQYGVTPANICQVAWGLVLRSFANSDDVCFAYVTARRQTPLAGIQDAVGPFLDVLFCRLNMEGSAGVSELLSLANQDFLASLEHQNTTIAMKNDAHGTSVREWGNTILSFTRAVPAREYARAGLAFELLQRATPTDYDVSVNIDIGADNLDFNLDFWESKMDRPLAQSILGVFQEAISFVLRSGSQETIHKFSPLTEAHKAELGRSLGPSGENTFFACSEVCIHDLVQEIAARQPRSPAVCAWDGTWTFEQLVDSASALSRVLILEQSVKPDNTTVGICMEKSKWTVVAMLAVLMSGAAIVPVGADDPRAEELLRSANASFVLASHNTCDRVRAMSFPVIVVGDINSLKSTTAQENGDVRPLVAPDSPAWILFTSGSSGKPKGVVLEHRALSTSLLAQGKAFEIGPGVRTLQFAAYTFADSIPDIFGTLVMGGCVCAPSEEERTTDLARAMHKLLVNQATLTSTVAGLLLDPKEAPALRRLILSGEMPSTAVVKKWLPYTQVVNGYGQSEASVFACCGQITDPEDAANIGLPIAGRCWVVQPDDYNRLCPIGGPGELLIESPALARGYLNDTDRTASVFVDNPTFLEELAPSSSSSTSTPYPRRMYRTGDLVRQNSLNGTLTFLGRQDTQIKIRGQRVELGEIESTIAPLLPADTFSSVVVSLVKLSSPVQSEPKLVAALEVSSSLITSDEDTIRPLNPTELSLVLKTSMEMLQDTLLVKLPVYMVPGLFVPMTKLPVNASKKVDRRALQTILEAMDDAQIKALMLVDESQQQPRTETELQLQDLWAVAFSRPAESISIKEHFFQAGGDSVTAVRMVAAGRNVGIALTVADIFKYPRIEDLARVLEDVDDAATAQAAPGNDPQPFQLWEDHSDDDLLTLAAQCNVKVGQIEDVYPCTPLQEGLVAITAQRARADAYMVQRCYRIAEDVPLEGFQAAWERLVELITILRTRIAMSSRGVAVQVVVDEVVNWQQNHRGRSLFEYLQEDSQVPFDYGQPLTRVALINGGEPEDDHRYFVWSIHHSLFDGWSTVQTLNLLARLWTGQQLTSPPVPMSRFIQYLAHQDKEASRQFWKRHLHNVTSSRFPVLPHVEYQPSPIQKLTRQVTLDADRKSTVTTSTLLRATWAILLASYTGTQEAVMLLTLSGRNAPVPGILNILAPTLTSVPFRVSILPRQSLYDFLQEVQSRTTEMIPFEHTGLQNIRRLVPDLGGDFDPGHVFTVQASPPPEEGNSQAALTDRLERLGSDRDGLQSYALTLDCIIDQEDSSVTLEARFDADVLPSAHAESILAHFDYVLLIQSLAEDPSRRIKDFARPSMKDLAKIQAWNHCNETQTEPQDTAHELVQQRLLMHPDRVAVDAWDGTLTGRELDEASNSLAGYLISEAQVTADTLVGFCMNKSKWAIVAMLGILKSGGAVVPFSVQEPLSRIEMTARSSGTKIMVGDKEHVARLEAFKSQGMRVIAVQDVLREVPTHTAAPPTASVSSDNIAFVMHTSGSTGTPKGVVVSHASLCASMKAWTKNPDVGFGPQARILQFTAFTFDPANHEILSGLYSGGCVCVPSEYDRFNNMDKFIQDFQITTATLTPSVARTITPEALPSLQTLVLMGEAVKPSDVEAWLDRGSSKLVNAYGPTECTIIVSVSRPLSVNHQAPIIGYPLENVKMWVTQPDDFNSLCPVGAPGELLVEGPLVANGYLHDAKQTAATFVTDPAFVKQLSYDGEQQYTNRRMYRTGDIVRQNQDGSLTYIGRRDNQIKINGQRVETSEIENAILRAASPDLVQMACVALVAPLGKTNTAEEPRLLAAVQIGTAYIASVSDEVSDGIETEFGLCKASTSLLLELDELRRSLLDILPSYMVPSVMVPFNKIPLTSAGKVDRPTVRHALSTLSEAQLNTILPITSATSMSKRSPSSSTERKLQSLWASVLQKAPEFISNDDDFFQVGGDSISAMKLVAAARRAQPPVILTVATIFQHPRLSDLAAAMDKETHSTNGFSSSPETQKADSAPFALLGRASPNLLDHQIGSLSEQCGVSPEDIEDVYPCAPLQEGLIAITTKRPDKYVLRRVFRIHGDVHVFKKAWEKLWESLAIMRTRIVPGKAGALQVVVREPVHWQYASSLAGYMEQDRSDHMTYGSRLCRIAIINDTSASGHKHVVWTMHHSIYDGWSMLRTMDMLTRLVRNEPVPQPVPMSRFIRYLQDQNEESTRLFWRKHLGSANVIKFPELPIDPSFLPQSTQHARRHISRRSREALGSVTTSNLLRAAWAVLLAAYAGTDTDEVIIMAALSGRQAPVDGILNMVGPTVATVPVRVQIPQQDSLPTFLSRVQQDAVDMIPHEHTGLQNIKRYVPELDEGLFTPAHLFTVQAVIEGDDEVLQPSSSTSEMATAVNGSAKILTSVEKDDRSDDAIQGYAFNMECTIITDKEIDVDIWFDQTTISASQVHRILEQYENIVQQLFRYSNDESRLVCQLSLISPEDHSQISTWNKTVPERTTQCIHEILQEIAARQPDAPAICSWDGDLTYRELVETGSRLAHYLHNLHKGVGPEALLGLCMSKSKWALVAAVAILQAGAGVVPLGIGHPVVRIQTIVENTGTQLILTDKEQAERLSSLNGATTIIIDDALMNSLPPYTPTPACSTVTADNVSYVVFTSGSTGTPKGSVLEHGALAASLLKHSRMLHLEQNSRALQFAAFTFDNSISDIFATLFQGGCVCEPSEDDRVSNLAKAVWDLRVNFLSLTPTVAAMLRPQDVPPIEVLVVGGEPLDPNVIDIWGKSSAIINSYGPSECSILVACSRPLTERRDAPNVGLPVACCFWVVSPNDYNRLSPIGAPGELLLQGAQLGRGYINEPEKTAKAFVVNPTWVQDFPIARNQRLYRSGDLVRQNPDQSLTMLGRRDTQVKIHGQRVEIGEIESWIVRLMPEVRKAAVDYIALAHGRGDRVLVAALEMETTSTTKSAPVAVAQTSPVLRRRLEQLRTELRAVIPSYMIPNNFLPVTRLPLNPSSKLDRLALRNFFATLSASDWNHYLFSNASDKSVATETEALLRQLWATVLSFDENLIGREDKLFDLGGDSVVAMRLAGLAREAGLQLTVADILGTQVLEKMASAAREISPNSLAALRPDQYRRFSLVPDQQHKTAIVERTQRYDWFHTSGAEVVDVAPVTDFQAVSVEGMLSKSRMDLNYIGVDGTGPFDIDRLKTACLALIEQIETLRTAFVEDANHQFWQVILNAYKPNIREYLTDESIASFTETFIKQDMFGMPVQGRPPVDIAIITNTDGSNQHRILFRISHALYDAHSLPLVWETLMAVYKGTAVHPHASFVSYLSDIHSRIDESSSLSYWRQFLAGSVMPQLGQESHQNEVTTTSTKHLKASFLPKETLHIPTSVSSGMMPAVIVKAAWGLVLIEHTGLSDLIFAEASTGRNAVSPAVADAHGCCVTALPFRFVMPAKEDAGGVRTISELLDAVLDQQTKSIQHETIGTQRIINDCAPSSSWNRLTSLINHQRAPEASGFVLGETEYIPSFLDSAEDGGFYMLPDISISATQGPGSLEIRLGHAVDVVDAGVAARLLRGLCAAIKAI